MVVVRGGSYSVLQPASTVWPTRNKTNKQTTEKLNKTKLIKRETPRLEFNI